MEHTEARKHKEQPQVPPAQPHEETPIPPPAAPYSLNANGDPEFASVLLTLDHLLYAHPIHVVQKMVYSTMDVEGTLLALLDYYQEPQVKLLPSTLDLLVQGRSNPEGTIYIYTVPVTNLPATPGRVPSGQPNGAVKVEVVMSTPAFYDLINSQDVGKGSSLMAVNWIVEAVSGFLEGIKKTKGAFPPLSLFQLERGIRPQPTPTPN